MTSNKQSQALAVMAKAFEASQFKGDTIKGTISDGGAIWLAAQALYPDSVWEAAIAQITFKDGSAIEFGRVPGSTFATIYRAVGPLPAPQEKPVTHWPKYPGESTYRYTVRKFEREWVGNYRREQWVIYMASDNESIAHAWYLAEQARTGGYYQLADESVKPMKVISITCQ